MFRFLGFGRKGSLKQEELDEQGEEHKENDILEIEYARTDVEEVNFDDDVFHEAEEYGPTETDTDTSSVVAQETADSANAAAGICSEMERPVPAQEKEEILKEKKPAEAAPEFRRKSMETVPSDYLVTVIESLGQDSVKTELSEQAEQASNVFSQLSVDLFENTLRDDPDFPRDLDRIYSWFTDVLTNAERMTCAHVLLSTLTPNQLKFLFSSLQVDPDARAEVAYLDLAKSQASEKRDYVESVVPSGPPSPSPAAMFDFSRFSSLEFKPEDGLFGNMNLASSSGSRSGSRFSSLIDKQKSNTSVTSANDTLLTTSPIHNPIPTLTNTVTRPSSFAEAVDSVVAFTIHEPSKPPGFEKVNHLDGLFNRFDKNDESSTPEQEEPKRDSLKLSVDAPEFRPVPNYPEMAYANIFYSDFLSWLRTLRLHKYGTVLLPYYEKSKAELLKSSEEDLERFGVSALGARRKFKRVFEQILTELPPAE